MPFSELQPPDLFFFCYRRIIRRVRYIIVNHSFIRDPSSHFRSYFSFASICVYVCRDYGDEAGVRRIESSVFGSREKKNFSHTRRAAAELLRTGMCSEERRSRGCRNAEAGFSTRKMATRWEVAFYCNFGAYFT